MYCFVTHLLVLLDFLKLFEGVSIGFKER